MNAIAALPRLSVGHEGTTRFDALNDINILHQLNAACSRHFKVAAWWFD